jgi:hypothetical protein
MRWFSNFTWRRTGAIYKEVTEALDNHSSDHNLEAAFCSQLKRKNQLIGNPCRSLPTPVTAWLTMPTLYYPNI